MAAIHLHEKRCGQWGEEELLSESAESSPSGDAVVFLTLLFVYGRPAETSRHRSRPGPRQVRGPIQRKHGWRVLAAVWVL